MQAPKYIIVTDKPKQIRSSSDRLVLTAREFIARSNFGEPSGKKQQPKVINLSGNYDYLSKGYYVSLLAEARGMPCVPNVANIIALNWKRNYDFALPELTALLGKVFDEPCEEPLARTYSTYFGRHDNPKLEPVARRMFDLFRFPYISFDIKCAQNGKWIIDKIETPSYTSLPDVRVEKFQDALDKFTGSAWQSGGKKKQEKYWIAILHDPKEHYAPSNPAALKKFIAVGKKMGLWVELITKNDFASVLEYDALFIRETTAINNHTYRFASKTEQEDIPCIDDTQSIIRCCNKVYLKELLEKHHVPMPKTFILDRKAMGVPEGEITFPAVLKIPDGAFSRGIMKVVDAGDLQNKAAEMLKKSEIVLCQEFVTSEFDWRVGVLNNQPLFASKYYMAKGHWQIYNHDAKAKKNKSGEHQTMSVSEVPKPVLEMALKAAKAVGRGLYGVDLKQTPDGRVVVMEVNDNPNIDAGVEDTVLGDELYRKVLEHLVRMIEE